MGFLDRVFRKKNSLDEASILSKSDELLGEDIYWLIIDESLANSTDETSQKAFLISRLQKLTATQIVGFSLQTDKLLYEIYNSEMWCAGFIMNTGCSDDCFYYFRSWVISRGKEIYYTAKDNPDFLVNETDEAIELYNFQSFISVVSKAFAVKTGKEIDEYFVDDFKYHEGAINLNWNEDNPESMEAICPQLFKKLWK